MNFLRVTAAAALATACAFPAHSAILTYATPDAYNAATTGNTKVDFSDTQYTENRVTWVGASKKVIGITFEQPGDRLFILASHDVYSENMGGNYINNNDGGPMFSLTFDAPITAFALNFGTIWNWGFSNTLTETFTFGGDSTSFTLPGQMASSTLSPSFLGFTSDVPFTLVSINDPTYGLAIRDVTYGNLASNEVPEPASLALLAAGLLGVGATRRRKQNG